MLLTYMRNDCLMIVCRRWEKDSIYFNVLSRTNRLLVVIGAFCYVPKMAQLGPQERGADCATTLPNVDAAVIQCQPIARPGCGVKSRRLGLWVGLLLGERIATMTQSNPWLKLDIQEKSENSWWWGTPRQIYREASIEADAWNECSVTVIHFCIGR